jgi:hypothetical protein
MCLKRYVFSIQIKNITFKAKISCMCSGSNLLVGFQCVYQSILSVGHVGWHHFISTYFLIVGDSGLDVDSLFLISFWYSSDRVVFFFII